LQITISASKPPAVGRSAHQCFADGKNFTDQAKCHTVNTLEAKAVQTDPHREDYDYGRFAWIMHPDGNRIELWEPPKEKLLSHRHNI